MRSSFSCSRFLSLGALAALATVGLSAATAPVTSLAVPLHEIDYSGDQTSLVALDRDITAAGKDAKKLAAIEARLVALLRRTDGSVAARQAACERLGPVLALGGVPAPVTLKFLQAMLVDPQESDLARLALEPVPGTAIDTLLTGALARTSGRTRLGIIQTLGVRATASAVPALQPLLAQPETAAAAASALGQIGDTAALAALRTAPDTAVAVVTAKLVLARKLPTADGLALFTELERDTRLPAHLRAAAWRGLVDLAPAAAPGRIAEVLAQTDWTRKQPALEALAASTAPGLVAVLVAKLATYDLPTQTAVIAALGQRSDPAATPALVAAARHADTGVRAAALKALARQPGDRELVALLAGIAAEKNFDDAKLARASLAQLNGPDVSAAVLAGAEQAGSTLRVVFIEQLALRNLTEALPFLRQCRTAAEAPVRTAAVGALGDLAPATEQAFVLDWAATATDTAEQTRALRALVSVTLRDPATAKRAQPIYQRLEKSDAATTVRLLPVLPRLGGKESAECAARLAQRAEPAVADAAAATLARWSDRTAQASLVAVAARAKVPSARTAAAEAALRTYERNREAWSAEQTSFVAQLLGAASDPAVRGRLTVLLNRAADKDAAALVEKLAAEPALAAAAKTAALCIAANRAGPPTGRVSESEGSAKNLFDGKTATQWRVPVTPTQWVEVDFRQSRPLHRITLDQTARSGDFPEQFEVFVTDDVAQPGKAAVTGAGQRNRTVIDFPAGTRGRYVIIRNTAERPDGMWAISELFVD